MARSLSSRIAALTAAALFTVFDAEAYSFTWGPHELDLTAAPGHSVTRTVRITNNTNQTSYLKMVTEDWTHDGAGHRFAPAGSLPTTALTWLSVQPERFRLEPGETQVVQVTASIPPSASGGRYAALFATTVGADESPVGWSAAVGARMGFLVPIRVAGTGTESIAPATDRPLTTAGASLSLAATNRGDVHVRAGFKGVLTHDGAVVTVVRTPRETRMLPGQTRTLEAPVNIDLAPGQYELSGVVFWGAGDASQQAAFAMPVVVAR